MLLSAVSVLVVAQLSSEIPEGLMNNPVLKGSFKRMEECVMDPFGNGTDPWQDIVKKKKN